MFSPSTTVAHPSLLSSAPPPPTLPFRFRPRAGALNWAALHQLQLSPIIRTVDIAELQRHLDHLAFSDLTEADVPFFHSASGLHVFRLMQLIIEYLLHVQSVLYHLHAGQRVEVEEAQEELQRKAKETKELRREVKRLRETLERGEGGRRRRPERQVRPARVDGPVFACSECDAAFISAEYRDSHMLRRHQQRPPRPFTVNRTRQVEEEKEQQPLPSASKALPRPREEQRLRQVEAELKRERLRAQQRDDVLHSSLTAAERRQQRAEREREQHWRQLQAEHAQATSAGLAQLLQKVEQSVKGSGDGADSRVSREWLQQWQVDMQQMMESRMNDAFQREERQRKADLFGSLDSIEKKMQAVLEERREGENATLRRVTEELAQLKEETARLIDVRSQPRQDADIQTEAQAEEQQLHDVDQPQTPSSPPREVEPVDRQPRYPVFPLMPSLLARYPHSLNTVERIMEKVEVEVASVADELGLHQREEDAEAALRAAGEERLREAQRKQERMRAEREEDEYRRQQEAVDAELDLRRRTLEAQKAALLREEQEEEAQRTEEQRNAQAQAVRQQVERESAQLRRQQRDREEKAEEERWRLEEEERQRVRVRAALHLSPSLPVQQSPPSVPTPAFRLVETSPVSSAVVRASPRPFALEEGKREEEEEREWDWEEEEEKDREEARKMQAMMRRGAAGSSLKPPTTTLAERKAALMEKGFSLMRLQPPPQSKGGAVEHKTPQSAASNSVDLDTGSPQTPLEHVTRGRAKPPVRRHTAHLSPFRPPSASQASAGSWDE